MLERFSFLGAAVCCAVIFAVPLSAGGVTGAIFTNTADGTTVNGNLYTSATDVYLNGGGNGPALRPGTYYYQVTDPSGNTLLSTDPVICRQITVGATGLFAGIVTVSGCTPHATSLIVSTGAIAVQLAPFGPTPNNGGEYKVSLVSQEQGDLPPESVHLSIRQFCWTSSRF